MDLYNPLVTITPTLDADVLQVLAATTMGCTAAEVHRRMERGSDEGVRKVLTRLANQGIVLVETATRYPLYTLNRDHVVYPHIEAMTRARSEIIDRMKRELSDWEVAPAHAGIFGSFARNTAGASSDIDVLLVRPEKLEGNIEDLEGLWLKRLSQLERNIISWTGNPAQVLDIEQEAVTAMIRAKDPLVDSWRSDDVHLAGERILDILRRLK